jgi:hypothetical protein
MNRLYAIDDKINSAQSKECMAEALAIYVDDDEALVGKSKSASKAREDEL